MVKLYEADGCSRGVDMVASQPTIRLLGATASAGG
jgi:hypothetical protein